MQKRRSTDLPLCPACHARHMPASNGAGRLIWCDGRPVWTDGQEAAREAAFRLAHLALARESAGKLGLLEPSGLVAQARNNMEQAKARERIRKEKRTQRIDAPPIDNIDQGRIPEGI